MNAVPVEPAEHGVWSVRFTLGALDDLTEAIRYLLHQDSEEAARALAKAIREKAPSCLALWPYRGHAVPELAELTREYREIHVKSYRIIYLPDGRRGVVWILLLAHARRSIRELLLKRVLQAPPQPHS